jgi:hypothetical protein
MRDKPGPKEGSPRGVAPAILDELKAKLDAGEFVTGVQAQRWLEEKHGITRPCKTVWRWLKKAGGVLLVPRPSHSKKDPAAAGKFRQELAGYLENLKIPEGSNLHRVDVEFLGDLLDGFGALERLKRHAGLEFGVVSSAFAFHFVCVRFGLDAAPTHHNHSLATGPIFWVLLNASRYKKRGEVQSAGDSARCRTPAGC